MPSQYEADLHFITKLSDVECSYDNHLYLEDSVPLLTLFRNPLYTEAISYCFPDFKQDSTALTLQTLSGSLILRQKRINPITIFCAERRISHSFLSDAEQNNFFLLLYALQGDLHCTLSDETVILHKGECLINSKLISYYPLQAGEAIGIGFIIHADFFYDILLKRLQGGNVFQYYYANSVIKKSTVDGHLKIDTANSFNLRFFFPKAAIAYYKNRLYCDEVVASYVILIFSELLSYYSDTTKNLLAHGRQAAEIHAILGFIQENLNEVSVGAIADHFHYHPNHLNAIVKQHTGESITALIQDIRLKRAALMFSHGDEAINTIIQSVGYDNISFFYNKFKEKYGCTPREYRLQMRSAGNTHRI